MPAIDRAAAAHRRALALALRTDGVDYGRIAAAPDPDGAGSLFPSVGAARRAVARALREAADDPATERRLQALRLDRALAGAWSKAQAGDGPAIDRILAIEARRSRLLALDLPEAPPADDGAAVREAAAEVARRLQRLAALLAGPAADARPATEPCGRCAATLPVEASA
ncbi:hypothetical protein [Stella sp.]|uniref:hypothetical protein n=1 Tax=Stella sp. TaxID=2912054 RepID=UPI0035AE4ECD